MAAIPPSPPTLGLERGFALANLGAVALFALYVLLDEKVAPAAFAKLAAAYVGITLLILATAFVFFAGQAAVRAGRASGWKASPTAAIRDALERRWDEDRFLCLAWPLAAFLLLMPAFNAFKQRILPEAGFVHDAALAEWDRLLFGADPGPWLHEAIGSPAATAFFDAIYHSWFVPTTLGLCVVGLCAGTRTRAQYVTAYLGVWILLGAAAAYAFPAAGPAFYEALVGAAGAEPFAYVGDRLALAGEGGRHLTSLYNQAYLLRNLDGSELVVGGGISAIPSVHNAMAVLFAIAAFRFHWACGLAMSGFALLIWIGSVYLNWHYAVDGLIGAAGAGLLWYGAGRLVDWAGAAGARKAATATPAPAAA